MNHLIEIRSITLKPGSHEEFHPLYIQKALPLLKRRNFDVVAHGPSLQDENSYYGSNDWRQGRREAILALMEIYTDIVLELDEVTVRRLRG
jgi:hypothetical protein